MGAGKGKGQVEFSKTRLAVSLMKGREDRGDVLSSKRYLRFNFVFLLGGSKTEVERK